MTAQLPPLEPGPHPSDADHIIQPSLLMDATTGESVTINFFCSTCGKILNGPPDNRIACSSCLIGIPIPTSASEESGKVLHPGDGEIFKFFCGHCEQKFSSPVGFAGKRFNCPICSKKNVVPGPHSVAPAQEIPFSSAVPARDEFFPKFELEPCAANPASGQPEQLLLLDETCHAVAAAPRGKKMHGEEAKMNPTSAETDRKPVQNQDRCLDNPYTEECSNEELESVDTQPIRITHTGNGGDRTILPRHRVEEEPHELIPIRLGEEKGALPPPRVRQPDFIAGNGSGLFPDPGPKDDSFDRLFGDDIEIEKIFPGTETQV